MNPELKSERENASFDVQKLALHLRGGREALKAFHWFRNEREVGGEERVFLSKTPFQRLNTSSTIRRWCFVHVKSSTLQSHRTSPTQFGR